MKRFIVSYNDALGTCQMDFAWNEKRAWRYFNKITKSPKRPITCAEIAVQYTEEDEHYEVLAKYADGRLLSILEEQADKLNDLPEPKKEHSKEYVTTVEENSDAWKDLRERRFKLDNYRCVYCGKPGAICKKGLKLHHIYYGDDLLDMKSVVTTCDSCHGAVDGHTVPNQKKDGTPFKYPTQYDPRTPEAKKRFEEYVAYTNKLIDDMKGETEYE